MVYTPVNSVYKFALIPEGIMFNNSLFMITGEDIEIICALANSSLYQFYLSKILSGDNYQMFMNTIGITLRIENPDQ